MRRRPSSFKRRPLAAAPVVIPPRALLLTLACLFLLLALRGSPDPDHVVFPSTDLSRSAATTFPLLRQRSYLDGVTDAFNMTDEMLGAHSFLRQLMDQISLAKTFLVVAKEPNNLQFSAELSS
uniref:Uncharacterized protein n=1 Tax=Oryza glumipatula TaxID=40148 RepID=A0A0E0B2U1_9ORYZ